VIILDTNVLSELIRVEADPRVVAWMDVQPRQSLATTAVTKAELLFGVERLADGKRKAALTQLVAAILERLAERVLPFTEADAASYAGIVAGRVRIGRPILPLDAQIAAIALSRGAAVATRDGDFEGCGVELINPWST